MKLGNNLCKHQRVIKVTRWNLKVISLRIDLLHYILLENVQRRTGMKTKQEFQWDEYGLL